MSIQELKDRLSIMQVLGHYGLVPDRNGRLCCPFHEDKTPSMQVYAQTNTVYCFAGSCSVRNLDVIDFVMHQENCSKHEALVKCKSLLDLPFITPPKAKEMRKLHPGTDFRRYHKSMSTNAAAQEYCRNRLLDWQLLEIGYKSRKTVDKWGRGCIIFPLLNNQGQIVSLYGRSIFGAGHYYERERKGLYPAYPTKQTQVLILTESVIDAATLQGLTLPLESYSILTLYGTNGLTDEHLKAIISLAELTEIILTFDGDQAGEAATTQYKVKLSQLKPGVKISQLILPNGEDINSLAVSHEEYEKLFVELVSQRQLLVGKPVQEKEAPAIIESKLNTTDALNLIYTTSLATYFIKGGVRSTSKDLSHLKITLVVENERRKKSRNGLDLYEDRQIEKIAGHVGERLNLRSDLVELDLHHLTDELEIYRKSQLQGNETEAKSKLITPTRRSACVAFWEDKKLFKNIDNLLSTVGIIGEENNRRLGFCIVSSPRMPEPLHGLIQGSSGSGKTHLLSVLCGLVPEEWYICLTRATDSSFYNYQSYELKNKLISIEDKDAMSEEANLAFRELQSKGMVSQSTTIQDENGQNRSQVRKVYGPIASMACTTKGEVYLDDMNRCFLLAVDESEEQTQRILDYLKKRAAGSIDGKKQSELQGFMQDALRLLKSYPVVIPQATKISLPEGVKDKRRLNSLYLSLVKQVTLLHQYQRQKDGQGRLIATKNDLKLANEILFDAIVLKVDDLHGSLRSFYEKLKSYLEEKAGAQAEKYSFRQREVRQYLRLSRTSLYRYFKELLEMEYIQIVGGSDRRGFDYRVSYWDDNVKLRAQIQSFLSEQIRKL